MTKAQENYIRDLYAKLHINKEIDISLSQEESSKLIKSLKDQLYEMRKIALRTQNKPVEEQNTTESNKIPYKPDIKPKWNYSELIDMGDGKYEVMPNVFVIVKDGKIGF